MMVDEPKEGFLKSGGHKLHYLLWGATGPKLVFIHSMGMDARGFDETTRALSDRYQILALDILDHGDSDTPEEPISLPDHADVMRDCYRQLGFMPNVLVGHSVGGMLGMVLAAEYPEDLKGLILVDIAPFRMDREGRPPRPQPPDFFEDEEHARRYIIERYPDFTEESVENRLKYSFVTGDDGKLRRKKTGDALRGSLATDLWPYVERMKVPTLLLRGATSQTVTEETVARMERTLPDLEVVTVEGVGHMIPQGKPAEFLGLLEGYFKRLGL